MTCRRLGANLIIPTWAGALPTRVKVRPLLRGGARERASTLPPFRPIARVGLFPMTLRGAAGVLL